MMRSLFSGVAGLRNHQTRMDVIGNNIANVNTVGFKASRTIFKDIFSQTTTAGSEATDFIGGANPRQVGLGMTVATIDTLFTQSSTQYTGNMWDVMINGDGFLMVRDPSSGLTKDTEGGAVLFTRAGNTYIDGEGYLVTQDGNYFLGYQTSDGSKEGFPEISADDPLSNLTNMKPIRMVDPADEEREFINCVIDKSGYVKGIDKETNEEFYFGRLSLATFDNQMGLEKAGNNLYRTSGNVGRQFFGAPANAGSPDLSPGSLEMSNVDLANEFTDMIITQRGFQANSRIITVSDTMLEELVNLKR